MTSSDEHVKGHRTIQTASDTLSLIRDTAASRAIARTQLHSQDLIVAQGLSGRAAIPAAVGDVSVGRDDVERVVDEVVLQDAVVGRAGRQGGRGVDLRQRNRSKKMRRAKEGRFTSSDPTDWVFSTVLQDLANLIPAEIDQIGVW